MRKATQKRLIILVFDENISGPSILGPLRKAGVPVKAQTEVMARGISDDQVLRHLSKHPDHYLLTHDADFHRHSGTVDVLKRHQVGAIVMTGLKNKKGPEIANIIMRAWPAIHHFIQAHAPPFVIKVVQARVEHLE